MKKLLFTLLKKYTRTEKGRLEVLSLLNDNMRNEYNEQTPYGNVYNFNIEVILANKFIVRLIEKDDTTSLKIIKSGLNSSFDEAVDIIKNEKNKK